MIKLIKSELSEMCSRCTPAQIAEELTNKYGQKVGIEVIRRATSKKEKVIPSLIKHVTLN